MGARPLFFALALLLPAAPAAADVIELTFTGYVQTTPTDEIALFHPEGTRPYTGANAPTYPVQAGDSVTVTFRGTLPDVGGQYPPPGAVDGVYRFNARGPGNPSGDVLNYRVTNIEVGDLGHATINGLGDSFALAGFDIVYDTGTGAYFIDLGSDGTYSFGRVALPSYEYDPVTDLFTPHRNCGRDAASCPASSAQGTIDTLTFSPMTFYDPSGEMAGYLAPLTLVGGFNLPTWTAAAPVDAPPALPLFAGALALLAWRFGRARSA